ncbi:MAG: beta-galactosidase [Verrucomicrobiota bacterium]
MSWVRGFAISCAIGVYAALFQASSTTETPIGEIHFSRIAREYLPHRMQMIKGIGVNSISTYIFWNQHESTPGIFDFSGNADVAEFCRQAQREGLKVIIRPGPYVCGESDFGGLPWWLLKEPNMSVRGRDPKFLEHCRRYFRALGEQLAPLQVTKGGPIIMVQVENEYAGYGNSPEYIATLARYLREAGFEVPLFHSEMTGTIAQAKYPGMTCAIGFSDDASMHIAALRKLHPDAPSFCSEFYTGWFDCWGRRHAAEPTTDRLIKNLSWILENKVSFNLYMAHGGTSFGFTAGANNHPYRPTLTSYDYDAPISEAGWPTPKYFAIRELMQKHLPPGQKLPEIPPRNPVITIPPIELKEVAPLFANLAEPKKDYRPRSMELYDQPHGCILYRTKLPKGWGERLMVRDLHDYGLVFLDGEKIGTIERMRGQNSIVLPAREREMTLDLLIEAMGRVNFGSGLMDRKGITEKVEIVFNRSARELTGWEVYNFPLFSEDLSKLPFQKTTTSGPAFYRATFNLSETGDTFLNMRTWGKGVVWINGHNLGRFWNIGPQQTLYCPGPWLKKGRNELVVFDLNGPTVPAIAGLAEPVLNELNLSSRLHRKPGHTLELGSMEPVAKGYIQPTGEWQTIELLPVRARYICLEALDSHSKDPFTTIAELEFFDQNARSFYRDGWKVIYADSEEVEMEDGGADNAIDENPGTFWHTRWAEKPEPRHPHQIVIDLGREENVAGIRYLPRQDKNHGRINGYRIWVSRERFAGLTNSN